MVCGNFWRSKPITLGITEQVLAHKFLNFSFCKIFPGQPLYRHFLWRVCGGYFAVHCYHHAAGDGSTGLLAMKGIFERYSKLLAGEKVDHPNRKEIKAKSNHNFQAKGDTFTPDRFLVNLRPPWTSIKTWAALAACTFGVRWMRRAWHQWRV